VETGAVLNETPALSLEGMYCTTKTKKGQKWYQSRAYDLGLGRLGFILQFKGPWPLKFK
jgi:hypothetical protein